MKPPTHAMIEAALTKPTNRALYEILLRNDGPVRSNAVREVSKLSIGQFGLALRALERMGLAQIRHMADEAATSKLLPTFVEATDMGREYEHLLPAIDRKVAASGAPLLPAASAQAALPAPAKPAVDSPVGETPSLA